MSIVNNKTYVKGKEASEILGIHQRTLYQWDKKGWIETKRTNGNHRLYNVGKYLEKNKMNN
jgi:putative resolvase